jgi:cytochrome c biogenesis protein CcmG, thiol:disulfide interchange protein DsbE
LPRESNLCICLLVMLIVGAVSLMGCEKKDQSNPGNEKREGLKITELKESPQEGFLAPGFSLQDLNGKQVSLANYKGKVILLNFWATWCPPCKREIPSLKGLYQLRKDKAFEILAVSVDRASISKVASFVADNQMIFPVLVDPQGEVGNGKYWVRAIPTSFLLDKKGVIRWKVAGAKEWDGAEVLNRIDQLLAE